MSKPKRSRLFRLIRQLYGKRVGAILIVWNEKGIDVASNIPRAGIPSILRNEAARIEKSLKTKEVAARETG